MGTKIAFNQIEGASVNAADYGVLPDGSDIGTKLDQAALAANSAKAVLVIPAGEYNSSTTLDWSALTDLEVEGAGWRSTIINFTTDVIGITFAGNRLENLQVKGIGASATQSGIKLVNVRRKYVQRVHAEAFYDGIEFESGNLSYFNAIACVSNQNDGFVLTDTDTNNNAATFGAMDLRGNGRDGLHMSPNAAQIQRAQQATGGLITCQSNGRYGAYITGRGHNLCVYDENNVSTGVLLDTDAEGCQVAIQFGGGIDNGANNDMISARIGSTEAWVHNNLQYKRGELNDRDYAARLIQSQTADRVFQYEVVGTSSDSTLNLVHPTAGASLNLDVDGRVTGSVKQNTDLATAIDVSGCNVLEVSNSAPTTINNFTNPAAGHMLTIVFLDNNTTVLSSTTNRLAGGVNFVASTRDTLTLVRSPTSGDWHEVGRSINA